MVTKEVLPFYLLSFLILSTSASFNIPFSIKEDIPIARICLGTKQTCYDVGLDFTSTFTWISDEANVLEKINKNQIKEFDYPDSSKISGQIIKSALIIEDFELPDYNYIWSTEPKTSFDGRLGLGYNPSENLDTSWIEQLHANSKINHRVISVDFANEKRGNVLIGEIPKQIWNDYQNYGNCKAERVFTQLKNKKMAGGIWECEIKAIKLGQKDNAREIILSNTRVQFDLGQKRNLLPITDLLKLEKYYFAEQINSGDCNFGIKNNYYTFTCADDNYSNLQDLILVFNDWGLHISVDNIFTYDEKDHEYEFVFYSLDGFERVLLGQKTMFDFTTVFDEENETIGFYSKYDVSHLSNSKVTPPKTYEEDKPKPVVKPDIPIGPDVNPNDKDPIRPILPDPNDNKGTQVVPKEQNGGFIMKLFSLLGILSLIFGGWFVLWLAFRYYRRKKYSDPSFYYKATDD